MRRFERVASENAQGMPLLVSSNVCLRSSCCFSFSQGAQLNPCEVACALPGVMAKCVALKKPAAVRKAPARKAVAVVKRPAAAGQARSKGQGEKRPSGRYKRGARVGAWQERMKEARNIGWIRGLRDMYEAFQRHGLTQGRTPKQLFGEG